MESTILHNVSAEEITSLFQAIQNQIKELKENFEPVKPTELLTVQECADLLKVDKSTLWNWHNKGKLIPFGLGNRVYYRRSDIEAALTLLGKKKGGENE